MVLTEESASWSFRKLQALTWQTGARRTNHDREFCYRYDYNDNVNGFKTWFPPVSGVQYTSAVLLSWSAAGNQAYPVLSNILMGSNKAWVTPRLVSFGSLIWIFRRTSPTLSYGISSVPPPSAPPLPGMKARLYCSRYIIYWRKKIIKCAPFLLSWSMYFVFPEVRVFIWVPCLSNLALRFLMCSWF